MLGLHKQSLAGVLPGFKTRAIVQHPDESYKRNFFSRCLRIVTAIEYWNISWWVAMLFTFGSVVWVINGFYVYLPFVRPDQFETNIEAGGWTAWLGATLFELGGWAAMIEAWNVNDEAFLGWAVWRALRGTPEEATNESETQPDGNGQQPQKPEWHWLPPRRNYWHDIGFLAALIQLCAATIFWIAGWTGLPVIFDAIQNNNGLLAGVYYTPQVIGGSGFIISGAMYMLENQKAWYLPDVTSLGWHVGFWNMLGGLGFTLCPIFGYSMKFWRQYQSTLSTFWGGWAFLIGSLIQWYQAVNPTEPQSADAKQEVEETP